MITARFLSLLAMAATFSTTAACHPMHATSIVIDREVFIQDSKGKPDALVRTVDGKSSTPGPAYERWKSCAGLFYPKGFASVSDPQTQLSQPTNIRELLQNLQLVWRQDFLLQPRFYDPATLRKLFAASAVSWQVPLHPLTEDVGFVVAQLDSSLLPGITVRAESRCWRTDYKFASGEVQSTAYIIGVLTLSGKAFPGVDLRGIRAVLGPETVNVIDSGDFDNGVVYAPVGKGSVAYADQAREKAEGGLAQRLTFFFKREPSQQRPELLTKMVDEDVVRDIEMRVSRHLRVEK